ncbi:hypothetical protein ON010_g16457 [Phytophthora cinnamomi]|nr:hypothetical protein ON010_g16457 [Phytophthora cinnamomi]
MLPRRGSAAHRCAGANPRRAGANAAPPIDERQLRRILKLSFFIWVPQAVQEDTGVRCRLGRAWFTLRCLTDDFC